LPAVSAAVRDLDAWNEGLAAVLDVVVVHASFSVMPRAAHMAIFVARARAIWRKYRAFATALVWRVLMPFGSWM
jgi:hypothetical protein